MMAARHSARHRGEPVRRWGSSFAGRSGASGYDWAAVGLVGIPVFAAAVVLLFTGTYLRPIFDFVRGTDR